MSSVSGDAILEEYYGTETSIRPNEAYLVAGATYIIHAEATFTFKKPPTSENELTSLDVGTA